MSERQCRAVTQGKRLCFDYTSYLSASCKKRWGFIDAIYGVLPIFGIVTRSASVTPQISQDQLDALALQVLSTQVNDETNIIRLITLAMQKHIRLFDICLPYALEQQQLAAIKNEFDGTLQLTQSNETLTVCLQQTSSEKHSATIATLP
ncbi:hypothetical protein [Biostraticola tofi]|uniref:Uncharacterized protein n=1 Tax=Biostraticola tofi TaxID=466109 RepID=A0A4V2W5H7_9GAMM|nr:hypothetical protein [Biostraticola tofi]TCV99835.1 hypothetical protein EDC52_101172 [Biostraticola tofi]